MTSTGPSGFSCRIRIYLNLKLSVVVPANVRQAKDSRQNEGVDVAAETKAFLF
jgi:hypothetical protein